MSTAHEQNWAAPSWMICLLSWVADPGGTSATYCNETRGKAVNAKNALSLRVLSRLFGAMCPGNNAARADF